MPNSVSPDNMASFCQQWQIAPTQPDPAQLAAIVSRLQQNRTMAAEVLPCLCRGHEAIAYRPLLTCPIPVEQVLVESRDHDRLHECRSLLAQGKIPPSIEASIYLLHGISWFIVSDGIHRTVAAYEAGNSQIEARLSSVNYCRPEQYRLVEDQFVQIEQVAADGIVSTATIAHRVSPAQRSLLLKIGIQTETRLSGFQIPIAAIVPSSL